MTSLETLSKIVRVEMPTVLNAHLRNETRKERAKAVRDLFKRLGLQGISVTAPNYSMAQSIDIRLPDYDCLREDRYSPCYPQCANCELAGEAKRRLNRLILAAFPNLDDRSDSQSDHFDYCLSIH
jgi:hypothetical protein